MDLSELIRGGDPILLDGAMGTQLALAGLEMGGQNCLSHPDAVRAVHQAYIDAGCDILITNTLTMNRISLERHGLDVDVEQVNLAGARLARDAAGPGRYVVGDLSSTGQMLEPYGEYTEAQFEETFAEQVTHLLAGGVDGFIVETMMDLREALCALRACRRLSTLPVLVTLSFQTTERDGRTLMGNTAAECAHALADAGASAVGANCGDLDPQETAVIAGLMGAAVDLPIVTQPNAGKPALIDGRTIFDMPPDRFAAGLAACLDAGARLVGGCCGTSPDHIRLVARQLGKVD